MQNTYCHSTNATTDDPYPNIFCQNKMTATGKPRRIQIFVHPVSAVLITAKKDSIANCLSEQRCQTTTEQTPKLQHNNR